MQAGVLSGLQSQLEKSLDAESSPLSQSRNFRIPRFILISDSRVQAEVFPSPVHSGRRAGSW